MLELHLICCSTHYEALAGVASLQGAVFTIRELRGCGEMFFQITPEISEISDKDVRDVLQQVL